jgi:hypothetical protein
MFAKARTLAGHEPSSGVENVEVSKANQVCGLWRGAAILVPTSDLQ